MKYRSLGRTGLRVSEIGHGLWGMGDWSESEDDASLAAMQQSLQAGCNFYDSAWAYGEGRSDQLLGRLVAARGQEKIHTATKIPPANGKWPGSATDAFDDVFPLDHVVHYAEDSRRRIGVEQIDLLQLHVWDDSWAADPKFRQVVEHVKQSGVAKHFGISLNRWEPGNGVRAIETGLIDVVQVIYNIFDQAPEDALLPICAKHDIGVIARVPLDEGSLGGKLTLDTRFPAGDWRGRYFGPENLPQTVERVARLKRILPAGMTLPELALRFILQNPAVSTVIVGMRKPGNIAQNTGLSGMEPLSPDLMAALREHRWDRQPTAWSG
jgi:aryl-alcohol dehydrogenase-like predicted oxidoreductase